MENATVLVVDDVSENLSFISEVIGDEYRVLAAKSGSVALAILERNEVDIILLDVVMPDMDGYEVITELKGNPKSKDIPVIFLTAKSSTINTLDLSTRFFIKNQEPLWKKSLLLVEELVG